jgi:hypothetical protein
LTGVSLNREIFDVVGIEDAFGKTRNGRKRIRKEICSDQPRLE